MSVSKFITFWIPNIGDIDIKKPKKFKIMRYEISEREDNKNSLFIDLVLNEETLNLEIFNSVTHERLAELILEYIYKDCNFLVYRIKYIHL